MSGLPKIPAPVRTDFLASAAAARLVAREGVVACLRGMAAAIEADFRRWSAFDKSARIATHSPQGVIELMPVSDAEGYGFKYVNGHPTNPQRGLPTVMAFGALADVATGMPVFLSELTLTTALRTAATSAMAARWLARPDSRVMALIGNGAQSEFQALAFVGLLGIRALHLYDVDADATRRLVRNLAPYARAMGFDLHPCATAAQAVHGADIVTTATADKSRATILAADAIGPGTHVNAIGGDCPGKTELDAALLQRAAVFVEYEPQTRVEGDIQQMPADFPVTELWRVIAGEAPGRRTPQDITVFDSVGFALEDYAAMQFMRHRARGAGLLETLDLVPALADPRDLFQRVAEADRDPAPPSAATLCAGVPA